MSKTTTARPTRDRLRDLAARLRRIAGEILRDEDRLATRLAGLRGKDTDGAPDARGITATCTEFGRSLDIGGAEVGVVLRELTKCEGIEDHRTLEMIIEAVDRLPFDEPDTHGPDFAVFSHWLHSTFAPCPAYLRRVVRRPSEGYGDGATAVWFADAIQALADHVEDLAGRAVEAVEGGREAEAEDELPGPLTKSDKVTLQALNDIGPQRLATIEEIIEAMPTKIRRGDTTARRSVRRLIDYGLVDRPEGERSGARITTKGQRLAAKIAD